MCVRVGNSWSGGRHVRICTYAASVREPMNMVHMCVNAGVHGVFSCVCVWSVNLSVSVMRVLAHFLSLSFSVLRLHFHVETKIVCFICVSIDVDSVEGLGKKFIFLFFRFHLQFHAPSLVLPLSTFTRGPVLCLISTICTRAVGWATMCE